MRVLEEILILVNFVGDVVPIDSWIFNGKISQVLKYGSRGFRYKTLIRNLT